MKQIIILIVIISCTFACDRTYEYPEERVSITFPVIKSIGMNEECISSLWMLILDDQYLVYQKHFFDSSALSNGTLSTDLIIGNYTVAFIANVSKDNITAKEGTPIEDIILSIPNNNSEPGNIMTALEDISIDYNQSEVVSVSLARQVGKIHLTVHDIPSDVTDIQISLEGVPSSILFDGTPQNSTTISKCIPVTNRDSLTTELYSFPFNENTAKLSISYTQNNVTRQSTTTIAPALKANQVMTLSIIYAETQKNKLAFIYDTWSKDTINAGYMEFGKTDNIIADNRPVSGLPSGDNLLINGSFEEYNSEFPGWTLSSDGSDNIITICSNNTYEGSQSAQLNKKTYYYQDIYITEQCGYQIQLFANSPSPLTRWRCFCTWRKNKSTAMPAAYNTEIQTKEQKQTNGWIEVFNSQNLFRAPIGAKILRIEFRTYASDTAANLGLLIDNLSVRAVDEN